MYIINIFKAIPVTTNQKTKLLTIVYEIQHILTFRPVLNTNNNQLYYYQLISII